MYAVSAGHINITTEYMLRAAYSAAAAATGQNSKNTKP